MRRLVLVALAFLIVGCGSKPPTQPSTPATPTFTATLLPANETTPVTAAEQAGSGTVTITLNITRDNAQTITAAAATFQVSLTGFPANTTLTGAHIHPGAAGSAGGVILSTGLANGEVVLANGTGGFTKNSVTINDLSVAQGLLNNPGGYYFNVHTTASPQGVARGQLVRTQ